MKKSIILFALLLVGAISVHASTQTELFNYPIDIPDAPTADEIADYQTLKASYYASLPNANSAAAEAYVDGLVSSNWASITNGQATQAELATLLGYASTLSGAAYNGSTSAQASLNTLLNGLTFRGFKKGFKISDKSNGRLATNDYSSCKKIAQCCVEAAAMYSGARKSDWLDFAYWVCELGQIYNPLYNTEINVDYMYNVAPYAFGYAFVVDDENLGIRHLKACSRYMSRFVETTDGTNGGLKADGAGFHHGTHYPNYLYSFNGWFDLANTYKGTAFRISEAGFNGTKKHVMCMYLTGTKPTSGTNSFLANSLAGRNPYADGGVKNQISKTQFEDLIEIGKDITGSYDPDLAAAYNYFFDANSYGASKADLDGFYQFNYSPVGVLRKDSWVVTMRAPTANFFGAEIYNAENRFGVYQSNGTLEVMYKGDLRASGVPNTGSCAGWDWNMPQGSTTVHFTDWSAMMPGTSSSTKISQRYDQYSTKNYAGALALGKTGIYATDFEQEVSWNQQVYKNTGLAFKKSFFAFDDMIIALGSNINATGAVANTDITATNLFQNIIYSGVSGSFIHNGNIISTAQNTTTDNNSSNWFVTPCNTGYYVPKGQPVTVIYGSQTSPNQTGSDYTNPQTSVTAAKAYLSHGKVVNNAKYEFVVVPGTNAASMVARVGELASTYTILRQDEKAHILKHNALKQTGYAVFASLTGITTGIITDVSAPALISLIEKSSETLTLAACSPILNFENGVSVATPIALTIKGFWKCEDMPEGATIQHDKSNGEFSKIIVNAVQGLSSYFELSKSEYIATGINKGKSDELAASIYPNPARDAVTVMLPDAVKMAGEINVYSIDGIQQKYVAVNAGQNTIEISLNSFNSGVYFFQIKVDGKTATYKVLKL